MSTVTSSNRIGTDGFFDTQAMFIYRKTIAGHHEAEHRHLVVRTELRRLLIMIDGHHSLTDLSRNFRGHELGMLAEELQALGLIEPVSRLPIFARVRVTDLPLHNARGDAERLASIRAAAIDATRELLGMVADPYIRQLSGCTSSSQLRDAISFAEARVKGMLGADAATLFIETIRDAARAAN
ncbi:MAG: hypothetical protein ACRCWJ_02570 [Casimicrobium sp.]